MSAMSQVLSNKNIAFWVGGHNGKKVWGDERQNNPYKCRRKWFAQSQGITDYEFNLMAVSTQMTKCKGKRVTCDFGSSALCPVTQMHFSNCDDTSEKEGNKRRKERQFDGCLIEWASNGTFTQQGQSTNTLKMSRKEVNRIADGIKLTVSS